MGKVSERGRWARRFRDIVAEVVVDLGGPDGLTEGQRQLARRAATLAIACEQMEGEIASGKDIDLNVYGTITDRLGRAFGRLGLRRKMKDITSLGTILRDGHRTRPGGLAMLREDKRRK